MRCFSFFFVLLHCQVERITMIFVTDKGRMCNNILQYAHLYAWGREHRRSTMSMRFAYKYPYFQISSTRYHNPLVYLLVKVAVALKLIPVVTFQQMGSDYREEQNEMLTHRFVFAWGWCVRFFDLFDKYKAEIQQLFAFKKKIVGHCQQVLAKAPEGTVRLGLHIRRGDYATWCGGHYFYTDEQYVKVIQHFCEWKSPQKVHLFICGNDPQLNRSYYQRVFGEDHVTFPDGNPAEDLCLLSSCDYLIGPPSTFTLVASLYHDTPLHWITNANADISEDSFAGFDQRSREFDSLFIPS